MSKQSTYNFDAQTQAVVNNLREKLGYDSNAEVLAKAITLLNLSVQFTVSPMNFLRTWAIVLARLVLFLDFFI